jgi:hypothetical protein
MFDLASLIHKKQRENNVSEMYTSLISKMVIPNYIVIGLFHFRSHT